MSKHTDSSYLLNTQDSIAVDAIDGLLYTNPNYVTLDDPQRQIKVVLRADWHNTDNSNKVALLSGGGDGHYPAHIGYVGRGMLTGAVCGNIYASPSSQAMLSAILATKSKNVILIVKCYTGDRLNFGLAAELAQSQHNVNVKTVLVADDVTQTREQLTGRRGMAGVVLAEKIVGAAAEENKLNIDRLHALGEAVAANLVTIGVASRTCDIPGSEAKQPIPAGKLELGIGIHGESGKTLIDNVDMQTTVRTMIDTIMTTDKQHDYAQRIVQRLQGKPTVVLMVNNTQALTAPELAIATKCAYEYLTQHCQYAVVRVYTDIYLSSLDMRGFSLTLLYVTDNQWLHYLDAPCNVAGWKSAVSTAQWSNRPSQRIPLPQLHSTQQTQSTQPPFAAKVRAILTAVANALIKAEDQLNKLDAVAGDADAGSTFTAGGKRLLQELNALPLHSASQACYHIADTVCNSMGGSSGAVLAIMLLSASNALKSSDSNNAAAVISAFEAGIQSVNKYSGSTVGARSMLDAIVPALDALKQAQSTDINQLLNAAAQAAEQGCKATETMPAKVGRASYLPAEKLRGVADAGATAIAIAFRSAADAASTA